MTELFEKIIETKEQTKEQNLASKILGELSLEEDYKNVLVLVLRPNYSFDFSSLEMFSIKGIDYVLSACSVFQTKVVDFDVKNDIIETIKQNLNEKKYVLVLFSDTPLLTKKTVLEIVDYFLIKKLCSLKFNRGFMFETNYLKSVEKIYNPLEQNFFEEDFLKVFDCQSFSSALNVLKRRIISYHQSNGVLFEDEASAFIDAMVNIEKGAIIGENVKILGKSVIKQNCKLCCCTLDKVILENNVKVENSIIKNSVILENSTISDYSVIKNQTVQQESNISNEKLI